jgi:ligand-binding sensor domain-containing protein/AraC-like DNA-binding protein
MKDMGKIKSNLIRHLWLAIILSQLTLPQLWGLNPDKRVDQYLLDQWGTSEGLPSNTINSIVQAPDGFLWLATSNGLVRFDGIKFSNIPFTKEEAISPRGPTEPITLLVNREGDLWIGSTTGLTRFRNGKFKTFTTADGLSGERIRCIAVDMKDNLWISFMSGYVDRFSRERFTHFNPSNGLEGDRISSIVEDQRGNLLFASRGKGIFSFREDLFSRYPIDNLDNRFIVTMYRDHKECLWIGTNKGLLQASDKGTARFGSSHGLSHDYIMVITEDSEHNLWIGTLRGLNRLKRKDDGSAAFESILGQTVIFCIYEDREKSLWIGTDNSGLKRLKDSKFTSFGTDQIPPEETIISIFRDRDGDTWLGSLGGKLFHSEDSRLIETSTPTGFAGIGISAIAEDSKGNLLLGTMGKGIFQKRDKTFVPVTTGEGLTNSMVISIFKDSRDNLWCCTFAGVIIIRDPGGDIESFTVREGLSGKAAYNVCEDKSGNIWIAADKGITYLTSGKTAKQYIKYYLEDVPAVSIYEDPSPPKGEGPVFWISTIDAGLKRLNLKDGTVFSYTGDRGMITNSLYQFFEEQGNFWIMSNNGILRVSKNRLNFLAKGGPGKIDCASFGTEDGMLSSEFHNEISRYSALQTKEGELWFVTKKGISIVNPRKIRINKEPPPVVIEAVYFDQQSVPLHQDPRTYSFKGIKSLRFHFTAPTFLSPKKTKFKYRLEGYDEDWIFLPPGSRQMVHYGDMDPGTYTFAVTACNAEGIWNPKSAFITFTLEPFFYETPVFKIAVLTLFIILAASAIHIYRRIRTGKKIKENIKEMDKDNEENEEKIKYKSSSLTPEFALECEKKLKHLMEVEKVYRDEQISLQSLAQKIPTKPYILSQVLNERLNRSFYDFINYYRIEEAKKILKSQRKAHLKITVVGEEVGFNTTTVFYKVFKEYTGMTPRQYKKQASQ